MLAEFSEAREPELDIGLYAYSVSERPGTVGELGDVVATAVSGAIADREDPVEKRRAELEVLLARVAADRRCRDRNEAYRRRIDAAGRAVDIERLEAVGSREVVPADSEVASIRERELVPDASVRVDPTRAAYRDLSCFRHVFAIQVAPHN